MKLDDEQIERYSRQLILAEVGPHGQARLGAARVAVFGTGIAAARVVAYLAAAGVGWIAAETELHDVVDPAQPDVALATVAASDPASVARWAPLDALVVTASSLDGASVLLRDATPASTTFWTAAGLVSAIPPCPACAAGAHATTEPTAELTALRDALCGTVIATEVVKALLAAGDSLRGRMLAYDPARATIASLDVRPRPECATCNGR